MMTGSSPPPKEGGLDKRYYERKSLDDLRHPSSQKFHDLCDAMKAMHDKKQQDYGRANDPFANVRASEDFGIPGWAGCMVRANDKMRRIQKAASGGTLSNEGVEDSLMDLAVYSIIALVLYHEQQCGPVALRREHFEEGALEGQVEGTLLVERTERGFFVQQENGEVWWTPNK